MKASDPKFVPAERKRYVPVEKVSPLIHWLMQRYETLKNVAAVTGIPIGTLNSILYDSKRNKVRPEIAENLARFVAAHRRAKGSNILDSRFENEVPARFALPEERRMAARK